MNLDSGDSVMDVARVIEEDDETGGLPTETTEGAAVTEGQE
jgi:hypothetical protein